MKNIRTFEIYAVKRSARFFTTSCILYFSCTCFQTSTVYIITLIIQVYVHNNAAYAEDSAFFTIIGPGREIGIKISAEIFKADPELNQINIKARKCLLHGEVLAQI